MRGTVRLWDESPCREEAGHAQSAQKEVFVIPRTPEETRALFDRWAVTYDTDLARNGGNATGLLAGHGESLREAASLVTLKPGDRILDIGIGTGAFAATLARSDSLVSGADLSDAMLSSCERLHPDYVLRQGDFLAIPFAAEHADVVISSFALHHVPLAERLSACRELFRVAKPAGVVCLLDIMFASEASCEAAKAVLDEDEDYPLVGDLDRALRSAGFSNTFWRQTAPCHWVVMARRPG